MFQRNFKIRCLCKVQRYSQSILSCSLKYEGDTNYICFMIVWFFFSNTSMRANYVGNDNLDVIYNENEIPE